MGSPRSIVPCALALAGAALLLPGPHLEAFTALGFDLGLDQRDARVFNNFQDPTANDNTTPDPNWPGFTGAPLALWKAVAEWGSRLHGDGSGDPSQPFDVGSGGANFDATWQGLAPGPGGASANIAYAMSMGGGVLSTVEVGPGGWRIIFNDDLVWDDGPGVSITGLDLQGVMAHEYGHAIGLGHSSVSGATMRGAISGNGVPARSIEADDIAGVQFVYGAAAPFKPEIQAVSGAAPIVITGTGFDPTANEVWFTAAEVNLDGEPVVASGVASTLAGTRIELPLPLGAGPGEVLVRVPGSGGGDLSNAFPLDVPPCPEPSTYCTPKANSQGCVPGIHSAGRPSASAGIGFAISASNVLNNKPGLVFYGTSGPLAAPFQGGFLCVRPPNRRTAVQDSGGNPPPDDCSGSYAFDFNAWIATGQDPSLTAGSEVWAQYFSRDPQSPSGTGLTDALTFRVCP